MAIDRRTLLQILPAAALARTLTGQTDHCGSNAATNTTAPYEFAFFTKDEQALLDELMELIIPADEQSPGAHAARTVEFADLIIASGEDYVKMDWRSALAAIHDPQKKETPAGWLARVSQSEGHPQSPEELFFQSLKQMTINGYYSSAIGIHEDLRYQGNTYVTHFDGCDHPEHQPDRQ